jgi:hypothetical protein
LQVLKNTKTIVNIPTLPSSAMTMTKSPKVKSTSGPLTIDLTKLAGKSLQTPPQPSSRFSGTPVTKLTKPSSAVSTKTVQTNKFGPMQLQAQKITGYESNKVIIGP